MFDRSWQQNKLSQIKRIQIDGGRSSFSLVQIMLKKQILLTKTKNKIFVHLYFVKYGSFDNSIYLMQSGR